MASQSPDNAISLLESHISTINVGTGRVIWAKCFSLLLVIPAHNTNSISVANYLYFMGYNNANVIYIRVGPDISA